MVSQQSANRDKIPGMVARRLTDPEFRMPRPGAWTGLAGLLVAGLAIFGSPARAEDPQSAAPVTPLSAAAAGAGSAPQSVPGTGVQPPVLDDVPSTAPIAPARNVSPEPQVEQKRDGNRHVAEVVVVPAGTNIHYSMLNREGQRPTNPLTYTPGGLSTQRFRHLDF